MAQNQMALLVVSFAAIIGQTEYSVKISEFESSYTAELIADLLVIKNV